MIYPVILCGGSGTRLWPLSRKSYPKQFSKILGQQTLFQQTCARFNKGNFSRPIIVTNNAFRFVVLDELADMGLEPETVILEPAPKNTAPAVLAALLDIHRQDPNGTVLILPADHSITDLDAFLDAVYVAREGMSTGQTVTFGIVPSHAETGYGYLELEAETVEINTLHPLVRFVEKPDAKRAQEMISSERYLWNGGIFMARVDILLNAYKRLQKDIFDAVCESMNSAERDGLFLRPEEVAWMQVEDISIDYAIMERSNNLAAVPVNMGWSDLGDWNAVWQASEKSNNGVALYGQSYEIDCNNTMIRSEKDEMTVVGIGLDNIFAVAMNDAVVIGDMSRSQEVKNAVALLKKEGKKQATEFPRDHRPWGWYETLVLGNRFQVKRIVVKPGAALSLQSHVHRSEHWTVVEGTARITVDDEVKLLTENQSIYIPLGAVHRMENPGKLPLTLIEVQSGSYLGEDDIIRYEDQFGRK